MNPSLYLDFRSLSAALTSHALHAAMEKGEILKSQAQLVLERNRQYAKLASCLAVLLVFACIKFLSRPSRKSKRSALTLADLSPCMRALMLLIVPTRVAWPPHYSRAARAAVLSHSKTITLDLHVLLADISSGKIELRHPEDLVDLLSGLRVDGWIIALRVDPGWSRKIQRGIAMKPLKSLLTLIDREEAGNSDHPQPGKIERPTLVLDNVAPSLAEPRLAAFLRAHYACAVEFTAVSGSISAWSTPWILAALPFCPHRHKAACIRTEPQTTPLFATLHGTLDLLARADALAAPDESAAPDTLASPDGLDQPRKTILAVHNISVNYAADLLELRERLHSDATMRSSYVARYGVDCWRERRVMLAWEAALLRAGMLVRWSVELRG
ncbi:uncharacterized protein SCHCODRAFT_01117694 [Schizophyllum commune H4-8]|nr:uncharacterized protein SCHCODRAFT_01117694 [Schizophyllum commune H4-8]KAI5900416.1 hypothetical protein SCHCODRAFT_01117694 [Schizophyllum commune H4-8]